MPRLYRPLLVIAAGLLCLLAGLSRLQPSHAQIQAANVPFGTITLNTSADTEIAYRAR